MIGQIINNNEILSVDKIEYSSNKTAKVYFNLLCKFLNQPEVRFLLGWYFISSVLVNNF